MSQMTFNEFCHQICDGLYNPNFPYEEQSTGYKQLRRMVAEDITPATEEETLRWETAPTHEELWGTPHLKYMRFLHPIIRGVVRRHWLTIKNFTL